MKKQKGLGKEFKRILKPVDNAVILMVKVNGWIVKQVLVSLDKEKTLAVCDMYDVLKNSIKR